MRIANCELRHDFRLRAEGAEGKEGVHVLVVQGDAAGGPVGGRAAAVDHDEAAQGRVPGRASALPLGLDDGVAGGGVEQAFGEGAAGVLGGRVAEAQREAVFAALVFRANDVAALGGLFVALPALGADGRAAQGDGKDACRRAL